MRDDDQDRHGQQHERIEEGRADQGETLEGFGLQKAGRFQRSAGNGLVPSAAAVIAALRSVFLSVGADLSAICRPILPAGAISLRCRLFFIKSASADRNQALFCDID